MKVRVAIVYLLQINSLSFIKKLPATIFTFIMNVRREIISSSGTIHKNYPAGFTSR
jgi:hypothetical protein